MYKFVVGFFALADLCRQFQGPGTVEVHKGQAGPQVVRHKAEITGGQYGNAGVFQQCLAQGLAGKNIFLCQPLPEGREVREQIEGTFGLAYCRAHVIQASVGILPDCLEDPP